MEEQSHINRRSTGLQAGLQDRKRFKMLSCVLFFFSKPTRKGPDGTGCGLCRRGENILLVQRDTNFEYVKMGLY